MAFSSQLIQQRVKAQCFYSHKQLNHSAAFNSRRYIQVRQAEDDKATTQEAPVEEVKPLVTTAKKDDSIPILREEDLQKGQRKVVEVQGQQVVLFWYRNELFAVQSRSPAEGAYSQGFVSATFTQDYGIRCPTTNSVFSLKTGEIMEWYPNNAALRLLTPRGNRRIQIYKSQIKNGVIYIDMEGTKKAAGFKGGSDSSQGGDDVFQTETRPVFELQGVNEDGKRVLDSGAIVTLIATCISLSIFAFVGSIAASYFEEPFFAQAGWGFTIVSLSAVLFLFFQDQGKINLDDLQ